MYVYWSILLLLFFSFDFDGNVQIVLSNQFLVRPNGQTGDKEQNKRKDRTSTPESSTSNASINNESTSQSTPEFSFAETVLQKVGKPLKDVIEQVKLTIHATLIPIIWTILSQTIIQNRNKFIFEAVLYLNRKESNFHKWNSNIQSNIFVLNV